MTDKNVHREPDPWAFKAAESIAEYMEPVTDRANAIVLYSRLDDALYRLVEARMQLPAGKKVRDDFARQLNPDGIFGSSKAKIMFGYAMGLFGKRTYGEINTLRELRNLFAHNETFPGAPKRYKAYEGEEVRFSHPYVTTVCGDLRMFEESARDIPAKVFAKALNRYQLTTMWYVECFNIMMKNPISIGRDGLGKEWGGALP